MGGIPETQQECNSLLNAFVNSEKRFTSRSLGAAGILDTTSPNDITFKELDNTLQAHLKKYDLCEQSFVGVTEICSEFYTQFHNASYTKLYRKKFCMSSHVELLLQSDKDWQFAAIVVEILDEM